MAEGFTASLLQMGKLRLRDAQLQFKFTDDGSKSGRRTKLHDPKSCRTEWATGLANSDGPVRCVQMNFTTAVSQVAMSV